MSHTFNDKVLDISESVQNRYVTGESCRNELFSIMTITQVHLYVFNHKNSQNNHFHKISIPIVLTGTLKGLSFNQRLPWCNTISIYLKRNLRKEEKTPQLTVIASRWLRNIVSFTEVVILYFIMNAYATKCRSTGNIMRPWFIYT